MIVGPLKLRLLGCVALALAGLLAPRAEAQQRRPDGPQRPPTRNPQQPPRVKPERPDRERPEPPNRLPGNRPGEFDRRSRMDRFAEVNPFRPDAEDLGPLRAGEDQELLGFAREFVPRVYQMLNQLKSASPERFRFRLAQTAPRLRQLRRVAETNPPLARRLVAHSEQLEQIRQAVRRMNVGGGDNPQMRTRVGDLVRRRTRDLLHIEASVLTDRADELEKEREPRVQRLVDELIADGADLSAEPPPLQDAIRNIRAAPAGEREPLMERLRSRLRLRFDESIERLRSRAEEIRSDPDGEVDRRAAEFMSGRGMPAP